MTGCSYKHREQLPFLLPRSLPQYIVLVHELISFGSSFNVDSEKGELLGPIIPYKNLASDPVSTWIAKKASSSALSYYTRTSISNVVSDSK